MMPSDNEALQLYLNRVRPAYCQLFNLAHAITGNCERAEYALQFAMTDYWAACNAPGMHHGFREGLHNSLIHAAVRDALSAKTAPVEFTWNGLNADDADTDPMRRIAAAESLETRRILVLRYGCGFSPNKIARLMQTDARRIITLLRRFEARARRKLEIADFKRFDSLISRTIRNELALPNAYLPDMGNMFRSVMADANNIARPNRLPSRIARAIVAVILAALCMLIFWFAAVLMQPAVIVDDNSAQIEAEFSEEDPA